jgi:ABC-type multidrug transport system ATPase subunit
VKTEAQIKENLERLKKVGKFSKGMKQRINIAAALLLFPLFRILARQIRHKLEAGNE